MLRIWGVVVVDGAVVATNAINDKKGLVIVRPFKGFSEQGCVQGDGGLSLSHGWQA